MVPDVLLIQFNETLQQWIDYLDDYSFETLIRKSGPGAWSLGQMYIHLLVSTEHFIEQMKAAAATADNSDQSMHQDAQPMFARNSFPARILEGPDNDSNIPQPNSKEEITARLTLIQDDINSETVASALARSTGKTRHPGLLYFSAQEWLQFAEMHLRHHFLQKERIDAFLSQQPSPEKKS